MAYDNNGELVATAKIWSHDDVENIIEVQNLPELELEKIYDLLIPTSPVPYTCSGRVIKRANSKYILLTRVKETENRRDIRFKVDLPGVIEHLIYDGIHYPMLNSLEVRLNNLSKGGVRFKAIYNTLSNGDMFSIRIKMGGESEKLLMALVVYRADTDNYLSVYGCRFLTKGEI
jgi:hypothetical protein